MPTIATHQDQLDQTCSPYFFIKSDDAAVDQMPLKSTNVDVDIAGVIADVRVTQVYCNAGKRPIEAIYVFPGSTRAAVYGMQMTIGERTIVANIEKKQKARQQYEQAKQEGKSASLLEQHRPNVFQMNVANIMPGDEIEVELKYTELLIPADCQYEFVYPTVVGPRYPGSQAEGGAAEQWVENPYLQPEEASPSSFDIQVKLSTGLPVQKVTCTSHQTDIQYGSPSLAAITLKPSETSGGDRDYILKYRLAGGEIESGLLLFDGTSPSGREKENFFLLMAQPPEKVQDVELPPREYIFIMDVSGSMGGFPMDITKTLLKDLIQHLGPNDRFNLMQFSFGAKVLSESGSLPVTDKNVKKALKLLKLASGSGGTEILPALKQALDLPRAEGMSCSIVVITDGYVTVEPEVFDLIRERLGDANLFAFGIGSSVNRHLIEGMAHVGGGEPFIVTKETEAAAQAATLRRYIQSPVLANLKLKADGFDTYDIEPPALPDLFAQRPVLCYGKWQGTRKGTLTLTGRIGEREYRYEVDVSTVEPQQEHAALRYLWARHAIKLLGDYNALQQDRERVNQITKLGLRYSLLTDYTSFIAVDSETRNTEGRATTVKQPVPLPQGVPETALGMPAPAGMMLRASAASYGGMEKSVMNFAAMTDTVVELEEDLMVEGFFDDGDDGLSVREAGESVNVSGGFTGKKAKSVMERFLPPRKSRKEQTIDGKTFHLKGSVWIDVDHTKQAILIRLQRGSDAYRALLKAIPQLAVYVDAEERILVNIGRCSIEIAPDGVTELTAEEIRQLQESWGAAQLGARPAGRAH